MNKEELLEFLKDEKNKELLIDWAKIASRKRCFYCKTEFETPFFTMKEMFNGEMLVHIRETHGFEPIDVLDFLKEIFGSKNIETLKFFEAFDNLFEELSY